MSTKKILFISINPFGYIPVFRYIIPQFKDWNIEIVSNFIKGNYSFSSIGSEKFIEVFNNSPALSSPTIWQQWRRYSVINTKIIHTLFQNAENSRIYSIDFQVLAFVLLWKKILPSRNVSLIYHQIEATESKYCKGLNLRLWTYFLKNAQNIDLTIVPEANRLQYLLSISNINPSKTYIFPNTCAHNQNTPSKKHPCLSGISEQAYIIGHIGNMGINYSYEYLSTVSSLAKDDVYFLFVGRQSPEITAYLKKLSDNNTNIINCSEIPHSELANIYPFIDLGVILYKGVDINHEYCAPNKLYEYWSYGIPVVAHQLKGLVDVFTQPNQGTLINMADSLEIEATLIQYISKKDSVKSPLIIQFEENHGVSHFLPELNHKINSLIQH